MRSVKSASKIHFRKRILVSVPIIRLRIVENSRKVFAPRKILHFACASFSRMTNELALLVVQTNASVTSRGLFAHFEPARHSRAKCSARSEESCAEYKLYLKFNSPTNPNLALNTKGTERKVSLKRFHSPIDAFLFGFIFGFIFRCRPRNR